MFFTGYIDEFEVVDDHRAGKIVVMLNGRLNKVFVTVEFYCFILNFKLDQKYSFMKQYNFKLEKVNRVLDISGLE